MHVGVEVGGVRAEGLDREDETRCDIAPVKDRADTRDDRVASRAGKQAEKLTLALEHPPQRARDRQHDVAVRDGLEDLGDDMFRKERRPLGLAARAEVAGPTGKREQVLGPIARATDPREAALEPAAGEVGLDGRGNDLAQRPFPRLVAVLVLPGALAAMRDAPEGMRGGYVRVSASRRGARSETVSRLSPRLRGTPGDWRGLQGTRWGNAFVGESSSGNGSRAPSLFSRKHGRGFDSRRLCQAPAFPCGPSTVGIAGDRQDVYFLRVSSRDGTR